MWICRLNRQGHLISLTFLGLGCGVNKFLSVKELLYTDLALIKDRVCSFVICNIKSINRHFDSNFMKTVKINGSII